jgi:hypothetical protein
MTLSLQLIMDKAYEGDETPQLALDLGFIPVVPPKSNRLEPWEYAREMYNAETKLSACFAASKVSAASFPGSKNWPRCSLLSSISRSSQMGSNSVNTP